MTEPQFSINFTARVLPVSGAVAKGDVLVYSSVASYQGTTGWWVVASAANRTSADSRAQAVALTAYGGSAIGTVTYQSAGVVATEVSGLVGTTAGVYQLVRVSTAGRLERIASYTTGDDVVGYAYPDGRVALHIGLPWSMIASLASGITGRKVVYGDGALGGAANVRISTDGDLTFGDTPADSGSERFSDGASVLVKGSDGSDYCVWQHQYVSWRGSDSLNTLFIGAFNLDLGDGNLPIDMFQAIRLRSSILEFRTDATDGADNGSVSAYFGAWAQGVFTAIPTSHGFYCGPNFYFRVGGSNDFEGGGDPFLGARGVVRLDAMVTAPSVTPSGCALFRVNAANSYHFETLLPGDDPSTGWRDMLATPNDTEQTISITTATSATPATVNLANGRIIKLTGSLSDTAVIIITPEPTSASISNRFVIRNKGRATGGISITKDPAGFGGIATDGARDYFGTMTTTTSGISGITVSSAGTQVFVA